MSRFFVSGYTSDSSSEEEDLLSSSEEESLSQESTDSEFANESSEAEAESDSDDELPSGPSYFLKKSYLKGGDSDSDSDNDHPKVVKSAKDKLLDDMKEAIESINVAKRTNQWASALFEFDRLGRLLNRANQQNYGTPKFYIACLGGLEDYIQATYESEKAEKTLNAAEARAFNTIKQRVKKQIKEWGAHYDLFRDEPDLFDLDEPLDEEARSTEAAAAAATAAAELSAGRLVSPVFSTLKAIAETRGKKNVDRTEQAVILEALLAETLPTGSVFELISVYQMLLSIRFDGATQWHNNEKSINDLLTLLEKNKGTYELSELGSVTDDLDVEPTPNEAGVKVLFGSVTSLIDRLDDEFTKSLQQTDPHSLEYIDRLKDEPTMYKLIVRGQDYVESITPESTRPQSEQLARIVARRLEHLYYKPDQLIAFTDSDPRELVENLVHFLTKHANPAYEKHAVLSLVYYYAVNNDYALARNIFTTAKVHAGINHAESSLQIQYNRALVQLGLSAFRAGAVEELSRILTDLINSQRSKELLGQGFNTKYPNQATTGEKLKLLPFHQHINLELLECVYMTCSLLIEIPAIAAAAAAAAAAGTGTAKEKRKTPVKSFKSKLEFHDKQFFTGPPESIKDHIVHALIALQRGEWAKSYALLSLIKIWKLLPGNEGLLSMLRGKLQTEGLRTYIFLYKGVFTNLSIAKLSQLFELPTSNIISIISNMIEQDEIAASINQEGTFVKLTSTEPTRLRLQELAIIMNEKVGLLTERNEKTSTNGYGKPQNGQNTGSNNKNNQSNQKEQVYEDVRFRCANVSVMNDEFQSTA